MLTHVVHMLAAMLSLADRFQLQNIAGVNPKLAVPQLSDFLPTPGTNQCVGLPSIVAALPVMMKVYVPGFITPTPARSMPAPEAVTRYPTSP